MKLWQLFLLMSASYIAPHLNHWAALSLSLLLVSLALIFQSRDK